MMVAERGRINPSWLVLDCGATKSSFNKHAKLQKVTKQTGSITGSTGVSPVKYVGSHEIFGEGIINPN